MATSTREDEDHARSLHHQLKEIFISLQPGIDNMAALQEVRRLSAEGRRRIDDGHCQAQLRQLERYARFYFSHAAHAQWARDTGFGGAGLRGLVLQLLNGLELRLSHLQAQQLPTHAFAQAGIRAAKSESC